MVDFGHALLYLLHSRSSQQLSLDDIKSCIRVGRLAYLPFNIPQTLYNLIQ